MNEVVLKHEYGRDEIIRTGKNCAVQVWGQPSYVPAMIGRIRQYGITQTQKLSRSNSAIRIFVDLTRSSRHSCAIHLSPFSKQNDNLVALLPTSNLR
jgi:hypothetical protein